MKWCLYCLKDVEPGDGHESKTIGMVPVVTCPQMLPERWKLLSPDRPGLDC